MKTIVRNTKTLSLIALAMFISSISFAQGRGSGNEQCMNNIPGITDEQKSKIEDLRTPHLKKMLEYKNEKVVLQAELRGLEISDVPDQKKIDSKIDELMAVTSKIAKERSAHKQSVRKILTPDQRVYFDAHSRKGRGNGQGQGFRGQGNNPCCAKGQGQGKACTKGYGLAK